jgi:hypothetical protein
MAAPEVSNTNPFRWTVPNPVIGPAAAMEGAGGGGVELPLPEDAPDDAPGGADGPVAGGAAVAPGAPLDPE